VADRVISYDFRGNFSNLTAGLATAGASTAAFGGKLTALDAQGAKMRAGLTTLGGAAGKLGIVAAAGLGLAAKAAMDWESAWAGVTKTVDGTATTSLGKLEGQLRSLATELPSTHAEIAGVAEAAGQLGVGADDVAEFTRTMVDLGQTTNLSAEEAATSIARLTNIMGTATSDVDRIGSALVDLGNNSATTEAEILTLGTRLAAAGSIAGLSEADVLAFAATLTSVGVEAEAGGTALSKVFTGIRDATIDGGEKLEAFAKTAELSTAEFKRAFEDDAAGAIELFIAGLGRINESGESTTEVFETLGLTDQRLKKALLSTAGAGDLLSESLDRGGEAWEDNSALAKEAEVRYATTASQAKIAVNQIKDASIDFGAVVLPVFAKGAAAVGDFAQSLKDLPGPAKGLATSLLGVTAVLGGGLWFTSKMVNGVVSMKTAMSDLGVVSPKAASGLTAVAKAGAALAVLYAAGAAVNALEKQFGEAGPTIEETTKHLLDLANGEVGSKLGKQFSDIGAGVDLLDANGVENATGVYEGFYNTISLGSDNAKSGLELFGGLITGNVEGAMGRGGIDNIRDAQEEISGLDAALAGIASSGSPLQAKAAFEAFAESQSLTSEQTKSLASRLPIMGEAVLSVSNAALLAAGSTADMAESTVAGRDALSALLDPSRGAAAAALGLAGSTDDAADSLKDAAEATEAFGNKMETLNAILSGRSSLRDYEQSLDDFQETLKDVGKTGKLVSKDGVFNLDLPKAREVQAALDGIASRAISVAEAMSPKQGEAYLADAREDFIAAAVDLGITEKAASRLAGQLGLVAEQEVNPKVGLETKSFQSALRKAGISMKDLDRMRADPKVDAAIEAFLRGDKTVKQLMRALDKSKASPTADLSDEQFRASMGFANSSLTAIGKRDETATIRLNTIRTTYNNIAKGIPGVPQMPGGSADGTTVAGQRSPYGDKVLAFVAPGEEIISNRFGQADRNRDLLKAINDNRFANGGTVGNSRTSGTPNGDGINAIGKAAFMAADGLRDVAKGGLKQVLKGLERQVKGLEKEASARKDNLSALRDERKALIETTASRLKSDLFTTGASTGVMLSQPEGGFASLAEAQKFGADQAKLFALTSAPVQSPMDRLKADIAAGREQTRQIEKLGRKGLRGGALDDLLENASSDQIAAFANSSKAELSTFRNAYERREKVTRGAGQAAADVQGYSRAVIKAAREDSREIQQRLKGMEREIKRLNDDGPERTGKAVGKEVNGAAVDGSKGRSPR